MFTTGVPNFVYLFPLLHVGVGLGMIYFCMAIYLNNTDIVVGATSIEVKTYPLYWFGDCRIEISDIKQLYTTEKVVSAKHGTKITYDVNVITQNNKQKKLVSNLETKDQGLFIESKIETTLGIKDEKVLGEVSKSA